MPLTNILPPAVLETILTRLAALFLAGAAGDQAAARQAAAQMLGSYHPETEDEVRLAANIIIFSFQALEALSQAATPDIPITRVMKLRSGAVSLTRQSQKAEQRLEQLQKARQQGKSAPAPTVQPEQRIEDSPGTNRGHQHSRRRRQSQEPDLEPSLRRPSTRSPHRRRPAKTRSPPRCPGAAAANPGASPPNQAAAWVSRASDTTPVLPLSPNRLAPTPNRQANGAGLASRNGVPLSANSRNNREGAQRSPYC